MKKSWRHMNKKEKEKSQIHYFLKVDFDRIGFPSCSCLVLCNGMCWVIFWLVWGFFLVLFFLFIFDGNLSLFKLKAPIQSISASETKSYILGSQTKEVRAAQTWRTSKQNGEISACLLLIQKPLSTLYSELGWGRASSWALVIAVNDIQ